MHASVKKILIADDEDDIREIIQFNLNKEGFETYTAKNGNEAIELAKKLEPDLIILDITMPYKTGIEVCGILRSQHAFVHVPIIMLTALNDEASHIKGLETGADDYISKPISPKVLVSRIKALFRRTEKDNEIQHANIEAGGITIDTQRHLVIIRNEDILLAKKEFQLLFLLASSPGRVFLRNEILDKVWGSDIIVGDRTIDVHIRKIRQKLNLDCISTIKGVGYKFVAPSTL